MSLIERALQKSRKDGAAPSLGNAGRVAVRDARARSPIPVEPPVPAQHAEVNAAQAEKWAALLHTTDVAAERSYKILRTQLLRRLGEKVSGLVAVSAVNVGDGKTVTALNLALSLARDVNTRVVLVDLDLQRPSIARYLGMEAQKGLDDYLAGRATIAETYHEIGVDRLVVVPTLGPVMHSSDVLRSPAMMAFLEELRSQQWIAILDMPPLLLGDDVLALAPHTDGLLLVVGERNTPRAALASAREFLSEMNVIGVVLNRSAERDDVKYY